MLQNQLSRNNMRTRNKGLQNQRFRHPSTPFKYMTKILIVLLQEWIDVQNIHIHI